MRSVVRFDTLRAAGAGKLPRQWPKTSVEDIALLQYTGGTTGKPKGAMLTHGNLSAACSIYKLWGDPQRISEPGEDKVICVLPLFHIFALTSVMLRGLSEGNELLLRVRFDVETTLHDIEVKKATVFPGVPTMWIALANTPGIDKRDFSSLRYAASGGAALPGRGRRTLPEADRPAHRRRLGHDRDLAGRHRHAARLVRQGRLHRPAAARHHAWTSSRSTIPGGG